MTTKDSVDVSIIIPVYNDQIGLNKCLLNLANCHDINEKVEVIVVDNGSSPVLTVSDAMRSKLNIQLLRCLTPGSYAARNAGIMAAKGQFFAFLDADCWVDTGWLMSGVASIEKYNGKSVIGGEVNLVLPHKPTGIALYQYVVGFGQQSNIQQKFFSATANLFCTREQIDIVGFFDEALLSGGDREWCWRAKSKGFDICFSPEALVFTYPRTSLRSAIKQTRRVTAGRKMLKEQQLTHQGIQPLKKQRSALESIIWILKNPQLSSFQRLKVLYVAVLIRCVEEIEKLRLNSGATAERE